MTKNLADKRRKWREIASNNKEDVFPTALQKDGKLVTSQRELAKVPADGFEEKVKKVRETFEDDNEKALKILGHCAQNGRKNSNSLQ